MVGTLDEVTFVHTTIFEHSQNLETYLTNIFAHEAIFNSLELYWER